MHRFVLLSWPRQDEASVSPCTHCDPDGRLSATEWRAKGNAEKAGKMQSKRFAQQKSRLPQQRSLAGKLTAQGPNAGSCTCTCIWPERRHGQRRSAGLWRHPQHTSHVAARLRAVGMAGIKR